MRRNLIWVALLVALGVALLPGLTEAQATVGDTLELVNQPQYGDAAVLHVHLAKRVNTPNSVLICNQNGRGVYTNELPVPLYWSKGQLDEDLVFSPLSSPYWDPSLPADCQAVVFKEVSGNHKPTLLTNVVSFVVTP